MLPLEVWRNQFGFHPYHFWGLTNSEHPAARVDSNCNGLVYEYAWQSVDAAGRDDIRRAIGAAEARLREYLGYRVVRDFVTDQISYPQPVGLYRAPVGFDGRWLAVRASEGMIQQMGREALTLIATPAVVLSDRNGDGLTDTFSLSFATTITDPSELAVYFPPGARLDTDDQTISERWRVQPVNISIAGGVATITGRSWLVVPPVRYETGDTYDPADPLVYSTHLQVYRRVAEAGSTTATASAVLVWESAPWPGWACCSDSALTWENGSSDPGGEAYAVARAVIRDPKMGLVGIGPASYDATTGDWTAISWAGCRPPDRVILRYLAGSLDAVHFAGYGQWTEVIARLAAAELSRCIHGCEQANQELYRWQFDMSRAAGANDEQYSISQSNLDSPFGTRQGAIYAWQQVKRLALTRGIAA